MQNYLLHINAAEIDYVIIIKNLINFHLNRTRAHIYCFAVYVLKQTIIETICDMSISIV